MNKWVQLKPQWLPIENVGLKSGIAVIVCLKQKLYKVENFRKIMGDVVFFILYLESNFINLAVIKLLPTHIKDFD